jgi:C-terminal processing protease CtpA/Prc
VREAKRLEGSVGYLDLAGFPGPESQAEIDQALLGLEGVEALIIDLRRNGGGQPWALRYLSGFFFDRPTHLTSTMTRDDAQPEERWSLDGQPTRAFVSTPLFVLTSRRPSSTAATTRSSAPCSIAICASGRAPWP